jgi:hypothetical protein
MRHSGFRVQVSDWVADLRSITTEGTEITEMEEVRIFYPQMSQMAADGLGCGSESEDLTTEGTKQGSVVRVQGSVFGCRTGLWVGTEKITTKTPRAPR